MMLIVILFFFAEADQHDNVRQVVVCKRRGLFRVSIEKGQMMVTFFLLFFFVNSIYTSD